MKGERPTPEQGAREGAVSMVAPRDPGSRRAEDVGAAAVVHEVRNVMTAVRGWVQLARGGDAALVARALPVIEDGVDRARRLLDGVTSLDARAVVEDRAFDLDVVAARVADLLEATLRAEGVALHRDLTPTAAYGDPDRVAQVALNLGLNALQAILAGGGSAVTFSVRAEGAGAALRVIDDGPGMDEATRARVFDAFFSTKAASPQGARGLGLTVSRSFAESMGGSLDVTAAPGAGCAIRLTLRGGHALREKPDAAAASESRLRAGLRVLVLDDEASIREMLEVALSLRGARVIARGDVTAARRAVLRDEIDVALVDETLGEGASGSGFLAELARVAPRVGRVLMTGAADPARLTAVASAALVRKPFLLDDVVRALADVDLG